MAVTHTWQKYNTNSTTTYTLSWTSAKTYGSSPSYKELADDTLMYTSYDFDANTGNLNYSYGETLGDNDVSLNVVNYNNYRYSVYAQNYNYQYFIDSNVSSKLCKFDSLSKSTVTITGQSHVVYILKYRESRISSNNSYSQGSYIGTVTSTTANAYPTNGRSSSDGYWYVYQGNDNVAPTTPGTPSLPIEIKGGNSITISWSAASDTNGNLSGYTLECSLDNGAWTQVYKGSSTSYNYTVPKGTETIAFRVKAYDSEGAESGYATTSTYVVGGASGIAGGSVVNNVWKALTGEGYVNVNNAWRPLIRSLSCIGAVWKESSSAV